MSICSNCQGNVDNTLYCLHCGSLQRCLNCDHPFQGKENFCLQCGVRKGEQAAESSNQTPSSDEITIPPNPEVHVEEKAEDLHKEDIEQDDPVEESIEVEDEVTTTSSFQAEVEQQEEYVHKEESIQEDQVEEIENQKDEIPTSSESKLETHPMQSPQTPGEQATVTADEKPRSEPQRTETRTKKKKGKKGGILIGLLVIIAAAVAAYFIFFQNTQKEPEQVVENFFDYVNSTDNEKIEKIVRGEDKDDILEDIDNLEISEKRQFENVKVGDVETETDALKYVIAEAELEGEEGELVFEVIQIKNKWYIYDIN